MFTVARIKLFAILFSITYTSSEVSSPSAGTYVPSDEEQYSNTVDCTFSPSAPKSCAVSVYPDFNVPFAFEVSTAYAPSAKVVVGMQTASIVRHKNALKYFFITYPFLQYPV